MENERNGRMMEKKKKNPLFSDAKCCRCGKRIHDQKKLTVLDGKVYCEKCARAKRDWDFLALAALLED